MIKDAMTARTDLAANLAFTLPFSRTVARCDRLLAQIKTEVDRLLSIPDWEMKIYSKIKFRTKLSFAEKRLREYQESLHKLRDDLGFCMIAVQSHATTRCQYAQAGVSVVVPRIKVFNANFDFGAIHAHNAMMCFAAFMRDLGTDGRQPVDTNFKHIATAKIQREWIDVYEALVAHVDYFRRLVLHLDQYADTPKPTQIDSHVIFSIAAGKVVQWEQDSCDRRKRSPDLAPALMPASHKGERLVPNSSFQPHRLFPLVNGHFHQVYRILIDARSNAKPFETLLDALILHYIRDWSERFWKIVHDRFDKGDSFELSLEEKVQIVLWFWGYGFRTDCEWRCSWEVQVTILHSGPCFQSPWKADLHAFVSLCEHIRFYALHFTYYCMRVDGDEGSETFRILESQQHAFAIIPQLDPEMHIGYHLLDFRAFSDRTTLQGPVGCWFPTCEPSLDVSQIDAERTDPGDAWLGSHCTGCFYQMETSQTMVWQLMAFRMRPVEKLGPDNPAKFQGGN
ncbi:hypothetical protein LTR70_003558 [Exophiala xenobiotica]|uniref:Uncharacterized protein n=1 Tax=Lithohypha guttulata TaxID=1690604 RepID=A0ABR0KFW4_9EURO|nr:hypothetical protein LTR24_003106 [Lithohypha guttulata]KAK5322937.1 hypothetical protein LTR70_003558 [Exophiala xenobiotica]